MKKKIMNTLWLAMALTACTSHDEPMMPDTDSQYITARATFKADAWGSVSTRAIGESDYAHLWLYYVPSDKELPVRDEYDTDAAYEAALEEAYSYVIVPDANASVANGVLTFNTRGANAGSHLKWQHVNTAAPMHIQLQENLNEELAYTFLYGESTTMQPNATVDFGTLVYTDAKLTVNLKMSNGQPAQGDDFKVSFSFHEFDDRIYHPAVHGGVYPARDDEEEATISLTATDTDGIFATGWKLLPQQTLPEVDGASLLTITDTKGTDDTADDLTWQIDLAQLSVSGGNPGQKANELVAGQHLTLTLTLSGTTLTLGSIGMVDFAEAATGSYEDDLGAVAKENKYDAATNTYKASTAEGLMEWHRMVTDANNTTTYLKTNLVLTDNITLDGESNWTAFGNDYTPYTGTIDGGGHTLKGLTIWSYADYQGLVGCLGEGGAVKNLTLADAKVSGAVSVGGIVGYNYFGSVTDCSNSGEVFGSDNVGGIVGINEGTVKGCSTSASVSGNLNVGGIVGFNYGTVMGCSNTGDVSGNSYVGGITGCNFMYECIASWTIETNEKDDSTEVTTGKDGVGRNNSGALYACYSFASPSAVTSEAIRAMNAELASYGYQWTAGTDGGWPTLTKMSNP